MTDVYCSECGHEIPRKNLETKKQTHHLSGRPDATETIVKRYDCPNCHHIFKS